ncbi:MAG TPA: winged helix-turn-helix domain-containing protein [Aliidongia sp.]|uniref:ATP-binding protein n=1 Tax=Aliidongia sp. TaxID=1914230 RepID=UPI002DDCCACD|nr:winged helix-turn-helix domain-containing protein [Aliidongia sp.]HEV2673012.1 winged helix-turn-helix domain-containing protein [Aliidongia sp.]
MNHAKGTMDRRRSFAFGRFVLRPALRLLVADGVPVPLGQRAFDVLVVLAEHWPEVVSKDEFMQRIWGGQAVEENTLAVHISALRKALEEGRDGVRHIGTMTRRGYQLLTPVSMESEAPRSDDTVVSGNLPRSDTSIIGREVEVAAIAKCLEAQSLVTLAGSGGIGKTRLALAVGEHLFPLFPDGVWWVDLTTAKDPARIPEIVARVLGLPSDAEKPLPQLVASLRAGQRLLVLDNCEYVVEGVAAFASAMAGVFGCRLLITSTEPLGVAGEQVQRLGPLGLPAVGVATPEAAQRAPAVQLFLERVRKAAQGFVLDHDNLAAVVQVCRQLEGVPLALELAAARVALLGARSVALRLDEQLLDLSSKRRDVAPKHRTLRALMEWSYGLLSAREQLVLRRLSVFAGGCTLDAAEAVVADTVVSDWQVASHLASLIAKSLLIAERTAQGARYRMLETTRAFARERLAEAEEVATVSGLHAAFFHQVFAAADLDHGKIATDDWLARILPELDNLRTALDWCFGGGVLIALGLELTAVSAQLWLYQGNEGLRRLDLAFSHLDDATPPATAAALCRGKGWVEFATNASDQAILDNSDRTLHLARLSGDPLTLIRTGLSWASAHRFDGARARAMLDEVRQLSILHGFYKYTAEVAIDSARLNIIEGRFDEAALLIDQTYDLIEQNGGNDLHRTELDVASAQLSSVKGDLAASLSKLREILAASLKRKDFMLGKQTENQIISFLILIGRNHEAAAVMAESDFRVEQRDLPLNEVYARLLLVLALDHRALAARIWGFMAKTWPSYIGSRTISGTIIELARRKIRELADDDLIDGWILEGDSISSSEANFLLQNAGAEFSTLFGPKKCETLAFPKRPRQHKI